MTTPSEASQPPSVPPQHPQGGESNDFFTSTDVVLGKGNGINSLPGNLRFRNIIVKYKPLYAATPRSMKGTVAEMVINEIASLEPPGRFLEPLLETSRFREVSRKRAIEKTCQALREKKNNSGRPQQVVSPDQEKEEDPNVAPMNEEVEEQQDVQQVTMEFEKTAPPPTASAEDPTPDASESVPTIMENDVLYGGRGRRHFHRVANQRFLELVKMSRKEYHESRCKKAVAKRIVNEWKAQTPPGRFLQQDPKTEHWYAIKESKIMEKTCQALRDLKRERGPAGVKQGISDRMVDPWEKPVPYQQMQPHMNGPMHPSMNGQMHGHQMPPQGHHPYQPGGPWMGQGMYAHQTIAPTGMVPQQMPPPYMARPPPPHTQVAASGSTGMVQETATTNGMTDRGAVVLPEEHENNEVDINVGHMEIKNGNEAIKTDPIVEETEAKRGDEKEETDSPAEQKTEPTSVEEAANDMEVETLPPSGDVPTLATEEVPAPTPLAEMTLQYAPAVAPTEENRQDTKEDDGMEPSTEAPVPVADAAPDQKPEITSTSAQENGMEKQIAEDQSPVAPDPGAETTGTPELPTAERVETPAGESKLETKAESEKARETPKDSAGESKAESAKEDSFKKNESKSGGKDSAKDGDNHKKGELEAAALLANMFR